MPTIQVQQVYVAVTCSDGSVAILGIVTNDGRGINIEPTREYIEREIRRSSFPRREPDGKVYHGWPSLPAVGKDTEFVWRFVQMTPELETELNHGPYRNALKDDGKALGHDMDKVRGIVVEHVRRDRAPLLAELDAEWNKHTGQGNKRAADEVEAKRQRLRDRPVVVLGAIQNATSVAEVEQALAALAQIE